MIAQSSSSPSLNEPTVTISDSMLRSASAYELPDGETRSISEAAAEAAASFISSQERSPVKQYMKGHSLSFSGSVPTSTDINNQPQDYVITGGRKYRVKRSNLTDHNSSQTASSYLQSTSFFAPTVTANPSESLDSTVQFRVQQIGGYSEEIVFGENDSAVTVPNWTESVGIASPAPVKYPSNSQDGPRLSLSHLHIAGGSAAHGFENYENAEFHTPLVKPPLTLPTSTIAPTGALSAHEGATFADVDSLMSPAYSEYFDAESHCDESKPLGAAALSSSNSVKNGKSRFSYPPASPHALQQQYIPPSGRIERSDSLSSVASSVTVSSVHPYDVETPLTTDTAFDDDASAFNVSNKCNGKKKMPPGLAARLAMDSKQRRDAAKQDKDLDVAGVVKEQKQADRSRLLRKATRNQTLVRNQTSSGPNGSDEADAAVTPTSDVRLSRSTSFLARRLQNAREADATVASPSIGSALTSAEVKFHWQHTVEEVCHLFVMHDNPQLGASVAMKAASLSRTGSTSTEQMFCMLECKDDSKPQQYLFIIGEIAFSGSTGEIEGYNCDGDQLARGSSCIVIRNMRAVLGDIKQLSTQQVRDDIIEIDLKNVPAEFQRQSNNHIDVESLFAQFHNHVDIIFDPYHTHMQWFPYWEGRRRMAPQFRSKGIGYLRLGDDMKRYGTAFLSLDAGHSYLDGGASMSMKMTDQQQTMRTSPFRSAIAAGGRSNGKMDVESLSFSQPLRAAKSGGAVGILQLNDLRSNGSFAFDVEPDNCSAVRDEFDSQRGQHKPQDSLQTSKCSPRARIERALSTSRSFIISNEDTVTAVGQQEPNRRLITEDTFQTIKEVLNGLEINPSMKWTERVDALNRLSDAVASLHDISAETWTAIAGFQQLMDKCLTLLSDLCRKQKNPNVLGTCITCCSSMAMVSSISKVCTLPWRRMMLELVHLLRSTNRMISEEANSCLLYLVQCGAVTSSLITEDMDEILTGVRGARSDASTDGDVRSRTAGKITNAANSGRVLSWLVCVSEHCSQLILQETRSSLALLPVRDIPLMLCRCRELLLHREEATRDAAAALWATLLVFELLHTSIKCSGHGTSDVLNMSPSGDDLVESQLLSNETRQLNQELRSSNHRWFEKLSAATEVALQRLLQQHSKAREELQGESTKIIQRSTPVLEEAKVTDEEPSIASIKNKLKNIKKSVGRRRAASGSSDGDCTAPSQRIRSRRPSIDESCAEAANIAGAKGIDGPESGSPVENAAETNLSSKWFEVKLVLRNAALLDDAAGWDELTSVLREAPLFFKSLNVLAKSMAVPRGMLLRQVLPFDEDTNSADQAAPSTQENFCSNSSGGKSDALLHKHWSEVQQLSAQAVRVRRLIRVKMADEADLQQAMDVVYELQKFEELVRESARLQQVSPWQLIQQLQ